MIDQSLNPGGLARPAGESEWKPATVSFGARSLLIRTTDGSRPVQWMPYADVTAVTEVSHDRSPSHIEIDENGKHLVSLRVDPDTVDLLLGALAGRTPPSSAGSEPSSRPMSRWGSDAAATGPTESPPVAPAPPLNPPVASAPPPSAISDPPGQDPATRVGADVPLFGRAGPQSAHTDPPTAPSSPSPSSPSSPSSTSSPSPETSKGRRRVLLLVLALVVVVGALVVVLVGRPGPDVLDVSPTTETTATTGADPAPPTTGSASEVGPITEALEVRIVDALLTDGTELDALYLALSVHNTGEITIDRFVVAIELSAGGSVWELELSCAAEIAPDERRTGELDAGSGVADATALSNCTNAGWPVEGGDAGQSGVADALRRNEPWDAAVSPRTVELSDGTVLKS